MKKTLAALLSCAMVVSMTACDGSKPAGTTAASATPETTSRRKGGRNNGSGSSKWRYGA